MKRFDLHAAPLTGTHCVEASAGTGKTFAIAHLYLRLLLERRLAVRSILVVTFTEAATEELRSRIRELIRRAHDAAGAPGTLDEPLRSIVAAHEPADARICLGAALRAFDEAAIFTIHGFCQRVLTDNAFESGARFDSELAADQTSLVRELAADFWRRRMYDAPAPLAARALHRGLSPDALAADTLESLTYHNPRIIPPADIPCLDEAIAAWTRAFDQAGGIWRERREEIQRALRESDSLNRTRYSAAALQRLHASLSWQFAYGESIVWLFDGFELCTAPVIAAATKKGRPALTHPFFDACERLRECAETLTGLLDDRLRAMRVRGIEYIRDRLADAKSLRNVHTFDDLLLHVDTALAGPDGARLAGSLRGRYHVALIDEFQDTDPVQYRIFGRLFDAPGATLYLIGDPKQAIYGFRGADIFTYMRAAGAIDSRYTQDTNFRSDPRLIAAVNTLFSSAAAPFVFENDIRFTPVRPPSDASPRPLRIDGRPAAPLVVWYADSRDHPTGRNGRIGRGAARALLCERTAAEISRLIGDGATRGAALGDAPVRPADIAVLASSREEAREVKQALGALRIPAVLHRAGNVFDTPEARDLDRILRAMCAPRDDQAVRAALCTGCIGMTGDDLYALNRERPAEFEALCERFRALHDLWRTRGFIGAYGALLDAFDIPARVLGLTDGERRMTNLRHLSELLQRQSVQFHADMHALCQWFAQRRDPAHPRVEEHELRLESDADAVQIVTIHRSKGLEFPIVFCPFLWRDARVPDDRVLFHDERHDGALTRDMGSDRLECHRRAAQRELLAENVRLMYVAVTRAKSRCYIGWGRFNQALAAAPAWLFHAPRDIDMRDPAGALARHMDACGDQGMLDDLARLAATSDGAVAIERLGPLEPVARDNGDDRGASLAPRRFTGTVREGGRLVSFTSLAHGSTDPGESAGRELSPYARASAPAQEPPGDRSLARFARGARAGIFFHELLERWDFTQRDSGGAETLVREMLDRYGYDRDWIAPILRMLDRLADASLPGLAAAPPVRLGDIARSHRLTELEFCYPIRTITPELLRDCIGGADMPAETPRRLGALTFRPAAGFMRGFIDCVFEHRGRWYIIDWKSNVLGDDAGAYDRDGLRAAMSDNLYYLQYYCYALALDRFLALRLPGYRYERSFGGVYYVFLRGLDNPRTRGVFADRPPPERIAKLRMRLMPAPARTSAGRGAAEPDTGVSRP